MSLPVAEGLDTSKHVVREICCSTAARTEKRIDPVRGRRFRLRVGSEGLIIDGLIEFERAFDAPASRGAMCASQRALP